MGRNKIDHEYIKDEKIRRVCFRKRRIGCIKKLMQISRLTDCVIQLNIYNSEDQSLLQYQSDTNFDFSQINKASKNVDSFIKLTNHNYDLVSSLEKSIAKTFGTVSD